MMKSKVELRRFCFAAFVLTLIVCLGAAQSATAQTPQQAQAKKSANSAPNTNASSATGASSNAPGAASSPCNPAATTGSTASQGAAASASAAVSNAANAVSNIGSIFGKKKAATPANPSANQPANQSANQSASASAACNPAVNAAASAAAGVASTVSSVESLGAPATEGTEAPPNTAAPAANSSTPQAKTPPPPNNGQSLAPAQPATSAAGQRASQPFTPPSNTPTASPGPLDPSKLPDMAGIHLGMSTEGVTGLIQKLHPGIRVDPQSAEPLIGVRTDDPTEGIYVNYTWPPNKQVVYYMSRGVRYPQPIAHQNMVDALREKYGKEILANAGGAGVRASETAANDSQINRMWWLFDEQGRPVPPGKVINGAPYGCTLTYINANGTGYDSLTGQLPAPTFCDSLIVVVVGFGGTTPDIATQSQTYIVDNALLLRAAKATGEWKRAAAQKQQQEDQQKLSQVKPVL